MSTKPDSRAGLLLTERNVPFFIEDGNAEGTPWDSVSRRVWKMWQGDTNQITVPGTVNLVVPKEYLV